MRQSQESAASTARGGVSAQRGDGSTAIGIEDRGLHAVLSGGGTGGHVFPALALAEELHRRRWQVSFFGRAHGMEARLAEKLEIPFFALAAHPVVGKGRTAQLRAMATLVRSSLRARALLRELDAAIVVGTGGYVSAPAVIGARLAGRPSLLLEPNARAGAANRWLSRLAAGAVLAYPQPAAELRCPSWVTGVPVRQAFFSAPDLPEGPPTRLLVLGGSQGARQFNETLPRVAATMAERLEGLRILHQAGEGNVAATRAAYGSAGDGQHLQVEIVAFLSEVSRAMAEAHLVLSRAGAVTLAEICAAGRPSLLAPLTLAGGHQLENARLLAAAGAAKLLPSDELTAEALQATLVELLADRPGLDAMARAARALSRPGATAAIADQVELLRGGPHA